MSLGAESYGTLVLLCHIVSIVNVAHTSAIGVTHNESLMNTHLRVISSIHQKRTWTYEKSCLTPLVGFLKASGSVNKLVRQNGPQRTYL